METLQIKNNKIVLKPTNCTAKKQSKISLFFNSLKNDLILLMKFSYLVLVLVILVIAVIEVKHTFNIDLFPGIDTPFDNVYYANVGPNGISGI